MIPYAAYKMIKNKRESNRRELEDNLDSLTSNLARSMIPDQVALRIHGVAAKLAENSEDFIPGTLSIVEKAAGVFIEWAPNDESNDSSGWVLTGEGGETPTISKSPSISPDKIPSEFLKLNFSIDVNDLTSFGNVEPKEGRFLYIICIRLMKNPYATALTGFGKITSFMQEQKNENGLRVHSDAGFEFEVVTQLELPPRPEIYRESPVSQRRMLLTNEYVRMKAQWQSISDDQESRFFKFSKRKGLVEKDVARTDRALDFFKGEENSNLTMLQNILMTYVMYNFDLGYVQGMSDFASPLLFVMGNEVDAFWCFVELMNKIHRNFEKDQAFIKLQMNQLRDLVMIVNPRLANYLESHQSDDMYFCFRWVLVWFKREFSFADTCKLWEVTWTSQPCPNFLLLICVAILDSQVNIIIDNKFGLTEILKHVNDLSMHLVLDDILTSAEAIFHQLSASQNKLPTHICEYLNLGESASSPL
uniref:TBC1 domain family member 15 n=1 Tax=Heterorhabditis bacteriophora TaxID=37862 RepID=A0A1I7XA38_HETBA